MWYKVQELTEQGLNKSQIRLETGLDRATVGKYQQMDENAFHDWIKQKRNMPRKLSEYCDRVRFILDKAPYLSAAQVEDRLKENYDNLPDIHSKTVYNFVQSVREEFNIPKPPKKESRVFENLPETAFGKEAQVDFGETWMQKKDGKRKKVHFFAMLLSRSRYKYVWLTDKPFTSIMAISAHHLAFDYFSGIPHKIIYDQDSVFIHDENLGDYLLTKEFSAFCKGQDFNAVFCRKADPQSKGKIENVVKYVKQNLLRGREYVNIDLLNRQALAWLERTANAKVHSTTRLIPKQQWEKEKRYLLPIKQKHAPEEFKSYKVRKTSTICFKGNYYTLPPGTYKDKESSVLVKTNQKEVIIHTMDKEWIFTHEMSHEKGKTISDPAHRRPKSKTLAVYQEQVLELFNKSEIAGDYLQMFKKNKGRYYRDNLQYILKNHGSYCESALHESLVFCIENKVFNARDLLDVMNKKEKEKNGFANTKPSGSLPKRQIPGAETQPEYQNIETSDINKYETIFK